MKRKKKIIKLEGAVSLINDGDTVAIGGLGFHNHPMALVREIIRQGKKNLSIIAGTFGSIDVDLLIAGGSVSTLKASYVGFEWLGMAPAFRSHTKDGRVSLWECDESHIIAGLEAASKGLPFIPTRAGVGTSLPDLNRDLIPFKDPVKGEDLIGVGPIEPDFVLLLAQRGDEFGNLMHLGALFLDRLMATAVNRENACPPTSVPRTSARGKPRRRRGKVIALVDELIPHEKILSNPEKVSIPHFLVDFVIELPFGAHPASSHLLYNFDEEHLKTYVESAKATKGTLESPLKEYFAKFIFRPRSHAEYLDTVGRERLETLRIKR